MTVGALISETVSLTAKWLPRALPLALLIVVANAALLYVFHSGAVLELNFTTGLLSLLVSLLLYAVLSAAVLRGMVRDDWRGFTGARLGQDEWNLFLSALAVFFITMLAMTIILVPTILLVMLVFAASGIDMEVLSTNAGWRELAWTLPWTISLAVFIFGLLACLTVVARLMPYGAGAIDRKKVVALEAADWTAKHTWTVTIATLFMLGVMFGVMYLGEVITRYFAGLYNVKTVNQVVMDPALLVFENLFWLPMPIASAALGTAIYRRLKPAMTAPPAQGSDEV